MVPAGKMPRAFEGRIEGDWLIGRGAGDMKSGCAALITAFLGAAEAVRSSGAKGALWLMLSTDEEYAGEEIKTALSQGTVPKADFAVIAEPTDLSVVHRQKGECWITCRFAGRSAHSSTPELGVNALMKAARFMTKLEPRIAALKTRTSPLGSPTMSLGTLQGGTEPNVVPDAAEAVIDVRYLPGETPEDYLSLLEEIANECRAGDPDFSVRFEVTGDWPSMETPTTHPAVVGLKDAAERILGRSVGFGNMTGWGEAGFMERFGVPPSTLGRAIRSSPTRPKNAASPFASARRRRSSFLWPNPGSRTVRSDDSARTPSRLHAGGGVDRGDQGRVVEGHVDRGEAVKGRDAVLRENVPCPLVARHRLAGREPAEKGTRRRHAFGERPAFWKGFEKACHIAAQVFERAVGNASLGDGTRVAAHRTPVGRAPLTTIGSFPG